MLYTLSAVLGRLNPTVFAERFTSWVEKRYRACQESTSPLMAKHSEVAPGQPVHLISAFVSEAQLIMGQEAVDVNPSS